MGNTLTCGLLGAPEQINANKGSKRSEAAKAQFKASGTSAANVHMLAVALDYAGYPALDVGGMGELTGCVDANNMIDLAKFCGCRDIVFISDNKKYSSKWPYKQTIEKEWQAMANRCRPGDYFVFFYAGHGNQSEDSDGDEADGWDEELCLALPDGTYVGFKDDRIAELLALIPDGVKIIVISDCCHSGTICDLDSADLGTKEILHMAAVCDDQEANDTGAGGVFTAGLLEAVETLVEEGAKSGKDELPLAAEVYNGTVARFGNLYQEGSHDQRQTFQYSKSDAAHFEDFVWPFWPGATSGWEIDTPLEYNYF